MWQYNKYTIGDLIGHKEAPSLKFLIYDVLCAAEEKKGDYLYSCKQYPLSEKNKVLNYREADVFYIGELPKAELVNLLKEAIKSEEFEKAKILSDKLNKQKR